MGGAPCMSASPASAEERTNPARVMRKASSSTSMRLATVLHTASCSTAASCSAAHTPRGNRHVQWQPQTGCTLYTAQR